MDKYCMICTRNAPDSAAATCLYCGEASWAIGSSTSHGLQLHVTENTGTKAEPAKLDVEPAQEELLASAPAAYADPAKPAELEAKPAASNEGGNRQQRRNRR